MKVLFAQAVSGVEAAPQFDRKLEIVPLISDRRDSWTVGEPGSVGSEFLLKADLRTSAGKPSFDIMLSDCRAVVISAESK